MAKKTVNLYEAKVSFSKLVARVERGEEIVIAKAGRPVAKLIAYPQKKAPRRPGIWKGRLRVRKDFEGPLPAELQAAFEG